MVSTEAPVQYGGLACEHGRPLSAAAALSVCVLSRAVGAPRQQAPTDRGPCPPTRVARRQLPPLSRQQQLHAGSVFLRCPDRQLSARGGSGRVSLLQRRPLPPGSPSGAPCLLRGAPGASPPFRHQQVTHGCPAAATEGPPFRCFSRCCCKAGPPHPVRLSSSLVSPKPMVRTAASRPPGGPFAGSSEAEPQGAPARVAIAEGGAPEAASAGALADEGPPGPPSEWDSLGKGPQGPHPSPNSPFRLRRCPGGAPRGPQELPFVCQPLVHLFFPQNFRGASRGWLVGWLQADGSAVVCCLLPPMAPHLVGLFLQQLNARLLKPSSSSSSSSRSSSSESESDKASEGGAPLLDHRVLPRPVELLGWWRGAEPEAACPFPLAAVLQQRRSSQQQQKESSGLEGIRPAWLDLRLDAASRLPVAAHIVTAGEAAAAAAAAAAGPAAAAAAPPAATAASRCLVFLFSLPVWISCSTLAAAEADAAQACAAAAFVLRPTAARTLLREAAQALGAADPLLQQQQQQKQQQQQQQKQQQQQPGGFEEALALLNVSAAVCCSAQTQLGCWRQLQLRQQAAAAAAAADGSGGCVASNGAVKRDSLDLQQQQQQQQQRGSAVSAVVRGWLLLCLCWLSRACCSLLVRLVSCCGNVSRAVCALPVWRLFRLTRGRWRLSASLQQMVLRLQTLAMWPQALSSSLEFAAALRAARRRELQQQQQQVENAAAGELLLSGTSVPPLLPVHAPVRRGHLPKAFCVPALCLYGGLMAVLVDVLLGLFLPQLLALLLYRLIPADACSSSSLSRPVQAETVDFSIPPLFPISLSETAAPRLYPAIDELLPRAPPPQQQQQQQQPVEKEQRQQQQHQHQQQQQEGCAACEAEGLGESPSSCAVRTPRRPEGPHVHGFSSFAAGAAAAGGAADSKPSLRQLMSQPTSAVLAGLFGACYCFLHVHLLTRHVHWLMDFPAGLKLNGNLTRVLGTVVLTAIRVWNDLTAYLQSAVVAASQTSWGEGCEPSEQLLQQTAAAAAASPAAAAGGLTRLLAEAKASAASALSCLVSPFRPQQSAYDRNKASTHRDPPLPTSSLPQGSNDDSSSSSSSSSSRSSGLWEACGCLLNGVAWVLRACGVGLKLTLGTLLTTLRLGWLGPSASMFLAASADLLMLATLHIFYVYLVCARLLHVNLKSLHSLFLLFRGQKWNVLRRRVDSADLSVDQLLIGCILFTVTVCLFPTTLVFYVSYLLIWLLIFCTQSLLRLALLLFFSFPFCLLAFRAACPHLFAAGIALDPIPPLPAPQACQQQPRDRPAACCGKPPRGPLPADNSPAAAAAAAASPCCPSSSSSSGSGSIYFVLHARPLGVGEIIWPPLCAAARATLGPLRPSALLPKILSGKIVRLSRCNSAWPQQYTGQQQWEA
ncbi:hypothetical protein Efla_001836 [Eimeria flavescens]